MHQAIINAVGEAAAVNVTAEFLTAEFLTADGHDLYRVHVRPSKIAIDATVAVAPRPAMRGRLGSSPASATAPRPSPTPPRSSATSSRSGAEANSSSHETSTPTHGVDAQSWTKSRLHRLTRTRTRGDTCMTWPALAHSKSEVKKAGKVLRQHATEVLSVSEDEVAWATAVARNWRQAHAEAENWAQMGCRSRLRTLGIDGSVTQRLKELPTIIMKLVREAPRVQLSTMEDIAGARAVVPTIADVRRLEGQWLGSQTYEIHRHRDYINRPPASGYRAVHLVMRHRHDRLVEIQLRTSLQNAWAELAEDFGHTLRVAIKNGEGPAELLDDLRELGDNLAAFDLDPKYAGDRTRAERMIAALRKQVGGQTGGQGT